MQKNKLLIPAVLCFILLFSGCDTSNPDTPAGGSQAAGKDQTVSTTTAAPKSETAHEITFTSAKTYKNSIGTTWVQVIFEVTNTGTADLYLSAGAYDLENYEGKLVASGSLVSVYPQVISPGEKAYYYEETTLDNVDGTPELTVLPRPDVKKSKVGKSALSVSEVEIRTDEYFGIKVIGRIENTTQADSSGPYVAIALLDTAENPIGVVFTILTESIPAGAKIGFEATGFSLPNDITADSVASFQAFAYDYQFQF